MPVDHSRWMHAELTRAGVNSALFEEPEAGHVHYFLGVHPADWITEEGPRFWAQVRRFLAAKLLGR